MYQPGGNSGAIQPAGGSLGHAGRDLGVEARVGVACAIVERRERGPARRQGQDPRERAVGGRAMESRLILRRALGDAARPVRR